MLYEIKPSNLHGLGVFATQPIPRDTIIISEPPLLWVPRRGFIQAYVALSVKSRDILHTLYNKDSDDISRTPAEGIWVTNRLFTSSGDSAVFRHISRINHSCVPNATRTWTCSKVPGHLQVIALRDIECGEEILHPYAYFGENVDVATRRKRLAFWDFLCCCERCVAEASIKQGGWKWRRDNKV